MSNIRPIIAIIFCRSSLEVSCPCLFLRETINKSTAISFLYFIFVFDSFKAAEKVRIFMTRENHHTVGMNFPYLGFSAPYNSATNRASIKRFIIVYEDTIEAAIGARTFPGNAKCIVKILEWLSVNLSLPKVLILKSCSNLKIRCKLHTI